MFKMYLHLEMSNFNDLTLLLLSFFKNTFSSVSCSPASLRQRSDLFYLQPDRSCLPSSPLWFSPAPLNDSSVEATIIRILAVRGLQGGEREGTCMAP